MLRLALILLAVPMIALAQARAVPSPSPAAIAQCVQHLERARGCEQAFCTMEMKARHALEPEPAVLAGLGPKLLQACIANATRDHGDEAARRSTCVRQLRLDGFAALLEAATRCDQLADCSERAMCLQPSFRQFLKQHQPRFEGDHPPRGETIARGVGQRRSSLAISTSPACGAL